LWRQQGWRRERLEVEAAWRYQWRTEGMTRSLDQAILDLEERARNDDPSVLASAAQLIATYPTESRVWTLRAYVLARTGNLKEAIADISRAMQLSSPEPAHHFDRGRYKLKLGEYLSAIDDFSEGLALCEHHADEYYRESLYFLRAEALIAAGRKSEALADLTYVHDDFQLWTTELRSKQELVARCR
jgi:tetratricopeptide (TPR) repeat protein